MFYYSPFRSNQKAIKHSDELKAFQVALLRRIGSVRNADNQSDGRRPLGNLGRYGGASVGQIKLESEKYRRIRDPVKIRMMKAKISLEQVIFETLLIV